jgi:sugar phosphate permease
MERRSSSSPDSVVSTATSVLFSSAQSTTGSVFFGNSTRLTNARHRSAGALNRSFHDDVDNDSIIGSVKDVHSPGLLGFFFGFMLEDPTHEEHLDDEEILLSKDDSVPLWNPLNLALFAAYVLTTAATSVPITLVPSMSQTLLGEDDDSDAASGFAPHVTAYAVLGTACGKFLLSSLGDVCGARRTAVTCAILLALSLLLLATCRTASCASRACFLVEFCQSVQWPCIIVIMATHYRRHGHAVYEGGIYVTSLASRFGFLMGIPISSLLLRRTHWRIVALLGAWAALIASSIIYLFVQDSPQQVNDPQNPIDPQLLAQWQRKPPSMFSTSKLFLSVLQNNVGPSLQHVLKSPAFYIVALAHTGSSVVRTSERVLATYYRDTSLGTLSENRAGGLAVVLSLGIISGLMLLGHYYSKGTERQRKRLVTRLYCVAVAMCYILAILAIPRLRLLFNAPGLVLAFQVMATFVMGFSIAVQLCQIPSLVGATFGCDKGLYSGFTDGVAYGLGSLVWRIVSKSVRDDGGLGAGWAYGWAAVALILIVSAVLMVEFMEHYFVRPGVRTSVGYETIIFA